MRITNWGAFWLGMALFWCTIVICTTFGPHIDRAQDCSKHGGVQTEGHFYNSNTSNPDLGESSWISTTCKDGYQL